MITFFSSIILLFLGYYFYSKVIEKLLDINSKNKTPAYTNQDNIDFLPISTKKNALINLLNIAGTGPIFGPILAALYGPVALLWIVFGGIFAGAVHDFTIGVISLKNKGATLPSLAEKYLFKNAKHIVNFFSFLLLILVATVFVVGPAKLLDNILQTVDLKIIITIIFIYYLIATLLPIDKIIGRFYPILGGLLLFSAVAIFIVVILLSNMPKPELNLQNMHPEGMPIFPLLFLVLSCGALSGFHGTQSPIISRTLQNEKDARQVFYGMMITESVIALIWGYATIVALDGETLLSLIKEGTPALVVNKIAISYLGAFLGTFVVLGVIVLPITSGDTAFRSLRIMLAEYFNLPQKEVKNRLLIAIPCFILSIWLCFIDFQILWRYFSWANQSLATISLWIATLYLIRHNKNMYFTLIPALFISCVVITYILYAPIGFALDLNLAKIIAFIITGILFIFALYLNKKIPKINE